MRRSSQIGMTGFDTKLGPCCVAWNARGIDFFELPGADYESTKRRSMERAGQRPWFEAPPDDIAALARRVKRHFEGEPDRFADVRKDSDGFSGFAKATYNTLQKVPPGQTITYGELARRIKRPGSARAVGRAVATNPMPLLIPCHRVLPKGGALGNFSAVGGAALKAKLLFQEGVIPDPRYARGIAHLNQVDPVMRRIIGRVGPYLAFSNPRKDGYNSLIEAILHQQLSIKAGRTITGRVKALTDGAGFPTPRELPQLSDTHLRGAGVSKQKISYIRDLATKVTTGELHLNALERMTDENILQTLTQVRGIGNWTAQMTLIFQLDRLDVLPVDDLGLRNGVANAYGLGATPEVADLLRIADKWRPFRSMGTWYIWQSQHDA